MVDGPLALLESCFLKREYKTFSDFCAAMTRLQKAIVDIDAALNNQQGKILLESRDRLLEPGEKEHLKTLFHESVKLQMFNVKIFNKYLEMVDECIM